MDTDIIQENNLTHTK